MASSQKKTYSYCELLKEYEKMVGRKMPLCGFETQVQLLRSIPDVIEITKGPPGSLDQLSLVPSQNSMHIVRLVKGQRSLKGKAIPKFPTEKRLESIGVRMPPRDDTNHLSSLTTYNPRNDRSAKSHQQSDSYSNSSPVQHLSGALNDASCLQLSCDKITNNDTLPDFLSLDFCFY